MKKGWLIGCGVAGVLSIACCAGVGFLVWGIFAMTRPVVEASEDFLGLLGQGKIAEAYAATASGYRAQQDEVSFTAAVKQLGLTEYSSASWNNRQFQNQTGSVEGTVTTKSGSTTPAALQLVQENGKWKVVGVRYGGVDLVTIKAQAPVPAEAELERMATAALLDFNQAIQAKDFTAFYDKLSDTWKKQTSPQALQKSFHEFIDKSVDISGIKDVKPQFSPAPAVDDKGVLVLAGRYPTQPSQVRFELRYVYEGGGWKMISISVKVGKD